MQLDQFSLLNPSNMDAQNYSSDHVSILQRCKMMGRDSVDKSNVEIKQLVVAVVTCIVFMVFEAVGGYLANSLAIASDALHLLTDIISFIFSIIDLIKAKNDATHHRTFGFHRAEIIGTLTSVIFIWVMTAILVYFAIERLIKGEIEINSKTMMITAAVGLVLNLMNMLFGVYRYSPKPLPS